MRTDLGAGQSAPPWYGTAETGGFLGWKFLDIVSQVKRSLTIVRKDRCGYALGVPGSFLSNPRDGSRGRMYTTL